MTQSKAMGPIKPNLEQITLNDGTNLTVDSFSGYGYDKKAFALKGKEMYSRGPHEENYHFLGNLRD